LIGWDHDKNTFDNISPLDHRYSVNDPEFYETISGYLSESAVLNYQLKVEEILVKVLAQRGICSKAVYKEVQQACEEVLPEEIYDEEARTRHNIRALVNCIRRRISDEAKPFVHWTATSYDIVDTANSLRYKKFVEDVLYPLLVELQQELIKIARREKNTLQIGRTHGQHAEPVTFGFAVAEYVDRLGHQMLKLKKAASELRGKLSGAVGAYNAVSLFLDDPEVFEKEVLNELGLKPAPISTQIVEPEFMLDYMHSINACFGIIANFSDDMRHLQRSEINEVGEYFAEEQVGSSTMPHKRNPINYENIKSMWKAFMPQMFTLYMDQISEHQRDLTNSASSRFFPCAVAGLALSLKRLIPVCSRLGIDREQMKKNFELNSQFIIAEPLYILLASMGHPDAHEEVRRLTLEAQESESDLLTLMKRKDNLRKYLEGLSDEQEQILKNPEKYTGIASKKTEQVCELWQKKLGLKSL